MDLTSFFIASSIDIPSALLKTVPRFLYGYNQGVLSGILTMTSFGTRTEKKPPSFVRLSKFNVD